MKRAKKSFTLEEKCGCGKLYVTCVTVDSKIVNLFTHFGKAGGCAAATTKAVSDMTTLALAGNIDIALIIRALQGASCPSSNLLSTPPVESCISIIARALEQATKAVVDG